MTRKALLILPELLLIAACNSDIYVTALRTEQMKNPMGIDTATPRLGWRIESDRKNVEQTAYRILAASSEEVLALDEGDLWDTGFVESAESQWIPYEGNELSINDRIYWKVMTRTTAGETKWSEPNYWSVGLLDESDWTGKWIGMDRCAPGDEEIMHSRLSARYLRKEFSLDKPVRRATAHIAGMGLYVMYVNGQRIGEHVLSPSPTDYRKSVIYNTFDVTPALAQENAIGVILGNGHFFATRRNTDLYGCDWVNFGFPKLLFELIVEFEDGTRETISSDTLWKLTAEGPIRSNNEYDGEEYDARKDLGAWTLPRYDEDGVWMDAEEVTAPEGTLHGATAPNMKVVTTLSPVSISPVADNRHIIDIGQNMTGRLRLKIRGAEGDTITLRFAETLRPDGELYTDNLRTALATDKYVCNGEENECYWAPEFVFHGFRYVEVEGYPDPKPSDFTAEVIADEMEPLGEFECSNDMLNKVYCNCKWGILGNYKGFPVDCPQRDEREPWLGDRGMCLWGESYIYGNGPLYSKWTRDICEAQLENGSIPSLAPDYLVISNDNVTWPYALPSACDMLYTRFGNRQPIEKCYPHIKLWMEHICTEYMTEGHILAKDSYGDWCYPPESPELIHGNDPALRTDGFLISTAYIVKLSQMMERFAEILGLHEDVLYFVELGKTVTEGFNAKFLNVDGDSVWYGNNTVTANILPLAFGLVPVEYKDVIVENIVKTIMEGNGGHTSSGVIGMQWLMKELSRNGYADIAWMLATNTDYPSWGYMVEKGATTIWELWNGDTADPAMNSGNHVMLIGDFVSWCYENLAGIRADYSIGNTGFKHIILQPEFDINEAKYAKASYMSPYGKIVSDWRKCGRYIKWNITVPANTTAEVHLPDGSVKMVGSGHYKYKLENLM